MKIKEDHIIAALILMIIIVIWSKFTRPSTYAPGQAGSFATQPTILSVGQDIKIATWTGGNYSTVTGEGSNPATGIAAVTATATDLKLGPGDLNRQGWALTSMSFGNVNQNFNCKFAGFRKQLQAGGGGQVWYCFTSNGAFPPSNSDYQQNNISPPFLTVTGGLVIPQFVFYQASSVSPFLDGGCVYKVINAGLCMATNCTQGGGTALQTLQLTKLPTGLSKCYGPDGTTDLSSLAANGDVTGSVAANGTVANKTFTAPGASLTQTSNTVQLALTNGGAFTNTATAGTTVCYWAAPCVASGCSGAGAGFIQNSGTVMAIAGNGSTSGISTAGNTVFGIDGVGTAGNASFVGAAIPDPKYIACGGSMTTASNIFTSNSMAVAGGASLILRSMWKTSDTPALWRVSNTNVTVDAGCTVSGIAVDRQAGTNCTIYIADSANSKIYKFTNGTWNSPAATWILASVKGIFLDSTVAAGTFLYAVNAPSTGTGNVFAIPVGTVTNTTITSSTVCAMSGLSNTIREVTVADATTTGGGTCYVSNGGNMVSTFAIPNTLPTPGSTPVTATTLISTLSTTTGQMFVDPNKTLYIANNGNNVITKVDTVGNALTFVGGGAASPGNTAGTVGTIVDSGASTAVSGQPGGGALFTNPNGLCFSPDKITMFVADTGNHNIRQIT